MNESNSKSLNIDAPSFTPRKMSSEISEKLSEQIYPDTENRDTSQSMTSSDCELIGSLYASMPDMFSQMGNISTSLSYDIPQYMYMSTIPNSNYQAFTYNTNQLINNRITSANKSIISNPGVGNQYHYPILQYNRPNPTVVQLPILIPSTVPNVVSPASRSRRNSCLKDKVFNTGDSQIDKHLTDLYKRINPRSEFSLDVNKSKFYVIKSYTEDHVHRSIKYGQWCSTQRGNDILNTAYNSVKSQNGHVYLFFSVNGSGYFCGVAEMTSQFDTNNRLAHWNDDKWLGGFSVEWLYVKDVPNKYLKHIILEYNDNRPITNSRDATEIKPPTKGYETLRIIHEYHHNSSLFDDFDFYESRERESNVLRDLRGKPPAKQYVFIVLCLIISSFIILSP